MGKRFNLKNKYKMSTRPTVSVFSSTNAKEVVAEVRMPHVFLAPVRNDLVSFVHDQLSCNTRHAHGVNKKAGMKHSAESWGTGRAVARIPRVSGSGTHRFCVWTKSAFAALERHFGSGKGVSSTKKGYRLQNDVVTSADMNAIINSDAVQSVLVEKKQQARRTRGTKPNPLVNRRAMAKLNPYSVVLREARKKTAGVQKKITKAERKSKAKRNVGIRSAFNNLLNRVDSEVDGLTDTYSTNCLNE